MIGIEKYPDLAAQYTQELNRIVQSNSCAECPERKKLEKKFQTAVNLRDALRKKSPEHKPSLRFS